MIRTIPTAAGLVAAITVLLAATSPRHAAAEVPERLIYTGNLSDGGEPFEGTVDLLFSIYAAEAGGGPLWSETHAATIVAAGKFSVELGRFDTDLASVLDGGSYFLEVSVDDNPMLPRVPVASVPYAFKARDADTIGGFTAEELGGIADVTAASVSYSNTTSGLAAADVQAALDEMASRLDALQASHDALEAKLANVSWNDLADIPAGFADGVDNEAGTVSWTDILNRPAGLDDGDDVGLTSVSWLDILGRPAGLDDGDDVGLTSVSWTNILNRPAGLDDGDDVGLTSVSWLDILSRPAGLDDGDDVGLTSVSWDQIKNTSTIMRSGNDFIFRSLNVRIQNGSAGTANINGLGNLIVGYDEARSIGSNKSGSHNLVIGPFHNYTAAGGLVAGYQNAATGSYATASGGRENAASGNYSSVSGGYRNTASGPAFSSVSGGENNVAAGDSSSVSGGHSNRASGSRSSVSGGYGNIASALYTSVSGGGANTASGNSSSVSGGYNRSAPGGLDWAAGGLLQDF